MRVCDYVCVRGVRLCALVEVNECMHLPAHSEHRWGDPEQVGERGGAGWTGASITHGTDSTIDRKDAFGISNIAANAAEQHSLHLRKQIPFTSFRCGCV